MLWQRVITAVVLLAALLPTIFILPPIYWGALTLLFLAVAGWEWRRLQPGKPSGVGLAVALVAAGAAWLWLTREADTGVTLFPWQAKLSLALMVVSLLYWLVLAPLRLRQQSAAIGGPVPVFLLLFACWLALFELRQVGPATLLTAMAIVWIADIGAYFVGRAIGRRKLAPSISPGKSWEGAIGGAFLVVVVGLIAAAYPGADDTLPTRVISNWGPLAGIVVLAALSGLSVVGDLHESLLKREAGVKDSGRTLPGHGGVLDRIDASDRIVIAGAAVSERQQVSVLGATGSIGQSTLDVIARHPDRFELHALTAHSRVSELADQCRQYQPRYAVVTDEQQAGLLSEALRDCPTAVLGGRAALSRIESDESVDMVMAAIVGAAGLEPTLAAAQAGKRVLLANKEALVMAGELFMGACREAGASILPIDSEHNAVFQCMPDAAGGHGGITRIVLTASGGPFREWSSEQMEEAPPEQACAHPNWSMGRKISVDSATMMNKGLELIEAHYLFGVSPDNIDVLIHPESIVHSMVCYADGSTLAQMGNPDMRTPIAHALAWPRRMDSGGAPLSLADVGQLNFAAPDLGRFPCLELAMTAMRRGRSAACILNAANEVAVQAFLDQRVGFGDIARINRSTMQQLENVGAPASIDDVLLQDNNAREVANSLVTDLLDNRS